MNKYTNKEWAFKHLALGNPDGEASLSGDRLCLKNGTSFLIDEGVLVVDNAINSYQNRAQERPPVNRSNPSVRAFEEKETIFDRYGPDFRDKVLVDMCSGGGMPAFYLAEKYGAYVICVERALSAIRDYGNGFSRYYALGENRVFRICADAKKVPLKDECADYVVGSSWIHHFEDQQTVLSEAFRLLKPGGRLIAHNEGVRGLLSFGTADEDCYVSVTAYKKSVRAAGFVDVEVLPWSRPFWLRRWLKASVDIVAKKPKLNIELEHA